MMDTKSLFLLRGSWQAFTRSCHVHVEEDRKLTIHFRKMSPLGRYKRASWRKWYWLWAEAGWDFIPLGLGWALGL